MADAPRGPPAGAAPRASAPDAAYFGLAPGHEFDQDALALAEQSAGIGVWSIDLATGLVRATAQFFRIMGLEPTRDPVPVERVRALRHPDDRARVLAGFRDVLEGGRDAYEIEYRIVRPDGELRWIFGRGRIVRDAAGKPVRYSGVDLDITDRKAAQAALAQAKEELERLNAALEQRVRERTAELEAEARRRIEAEARLQQAQKMEAVGQLTGGVAHDFNNLLQVILGNLQIAKMALQRAGDGLGDLRAPAFAAIETATRASHSAAQLVHRLLAFSRQQTLEPAPLAANALIEGMSDMIARTLGETIEVKTTLASDLWWTFADRHQLETALLNLVVNARDAMPDGGKLVIETANVHVERDAADDLDPGDYVKIAVSDTGCGIASDVVDKVFEPFFTTKDPGKGSGLGLSMVYGFVRQSGGHVRMRSAVGAGTTLCIYLPRSHAPGDDQVVKSTISASSLATARPGETVLLVEDNEDVRRFGVSALEGLGYRVLHAGDGASALRLLDPADAAGVHLLFTDVVLPGGMSGRALADAVRAKRPGLAVLFTSGYTRNAMTQGTAPLANVRLLGKPYTIERLAQSIREAIDAASSAGERLQ